MLILIFLNSLLVSFVRKSASWIIRGLTGVTSRSTLRAKALAKIRVLDLLRAQEVSLSNLRFLLAQFLRYPEFLRSRSLIPSANLLCNKLLNFIWEYSNFFCFKFFNDIVEYVSIYLYTQ